MGANIIESEDGMQFVGVSNLHGACVSSHNDHRVAMAIAMAATVATSETKILNASCVSKSFPHFWECFEALGGDVSYEE